MFQPRNLGWLSTVTEVKLTWWNFVPLAHGEVKLFMDCGNTLNLSAFIKVVSWLASAKQSAADLSMKHWESLHLQNEKKERTYEINEIWDQCEDEEWQHDPKNMGQQIRKPLVKRCFERSCFYSYRVAIQPGISPPKEAGVWQAIFYEDPPRSTYLGQKVRNDLNDAVTSQWPV